MNAPVQATAVVLLSVTLVLLSRVLLVRVLGRGGSDSVVDTVMEPLAGVYGLLLAFLVGAAADRFMERRTALQQELEAFGRVAAISREMPAPLDRQLRTELQRYGRAELAARKGTQSAAASTASLDDIWLTLANFEPARARETLLQSEALTELRTLREYRRIAANASRSAHGPMLWTVLISGALLVISVCAVAGVGDPRAPFYLTALTILIALTLCLFYFLSRPLNLLSLQQMALVQ